MKKREFNTESKEAGEIVEGETKDEEEKSTTSAK